MNNAPQENLTIVIKFMKSQYGSNAVWVAKNEQDELLGNVRDLAADSIQEAVSIIQEKYENTGYTVGEFDITMHEYGTMGVFEATGVVSK